MRSVAVDNAGNQTISSVRADRRIDNTPPAITSFTVPAAPLSGSASLSAAASDTGGSGVASVLFQYRLQGSATWLNACPVDTSSPYSCSFDTTSVSDGTYEFRAVATDNAGNTTTPSTQT